MSYLIFVLLIVNHYRTTVITFQKYNNNSISHTNSSTNKTKSNISNTITYSVWVLIITCSSKYFLDTKIYKQQLTQKIKKNIDKNFYFLSVLNGLLNTSASQEKDVHQDLSEIIYTIAKKDKNYISHFRLLMNQICNIIVLNKKLQYTKHINEYIVLVNSLKIFLEDLNIFLVKYKDINSSIILHYLQSINNAFFYKICVKIMNIYVLLCPNIIKALNNLILRKEHVYFKYHKLLFLNISTNENTITHHKIERIISYNNECNSIIGIFDMQFIDEIITHFIHLYKENSCNIFYRYTFVKYFLYSNSDVLKDIFITVLISINEFNMSKLSVIRPILVKSIIKNIFVINIFAFFYKTYDIEYFYPVINYDRCIYTKNISKNIQNYCYFIFVKLITEYIRGIVNGILYACEKFATFARENNTTYIFRDCQNILQHSTILRIKIYIEFFWLFICLMIIFSLFNHFLLVEIRNFIPFNRFFTTFSFLYIPIFIIVMLIQAYVIKYNIYIIIIGGTLLSYLWISTYAHIYIFFITCNLIYSCIKFYQMLSLLKMNNINSLWNGSILSLCIYILYVIINNDFKLKVFFILNRLNSYRRK